MAGFFGAQFYWNKCDKTAVKKRHRSRETKCSLCNQPKQDVQIKKIHCKKCNRLCYHNVFLKKLCKREKYQCYMVEKPAKPGVCNAAM